MHSKFNKKILNQHIVINKPTNPNRLVSPRWPDSLALMPRHCLSGPTSGVLLVHASALPLWHVEADGVVDCAVTYNDGASAPAVTRYGQQSEKCAPIQLFRAANFEICTFFSHSQNQVSVGILPHI